MRFLIALLALIAVVAGCIGQQTGENGTASNGQGNCTDVGCPVDITQPQATNTCGNGILEKPEECDVNFPCDSGYCQHCKCLTPAASELVENCSAQCKSIGYPDGKIVPDANCTYPTGNDLQCTIRCSYRKVFPVKEEGSVCCCNDLKYIRCKESVTVGGANPTSNCQCPTADEVTKLCQANKPGANSTSSDTTSTIPSLTPQE